MNVSPDRPANRFVEKIAEQRVRRLRDDDRSMPRSEANEIGSREHVRPTVVSVAKAN